MKFEFDTIDNAKIQDGQIIASHQGRAIFLIKSEKRALQYTMRCAYRKTFDDLPIYFDQPYEHLKSPIENIVNFIKALMKADKDFKTKKEERAGEPRFIDHLEKL